MCFCCSLKRFFLLLLLLFLFAWFFFVLIFLEFLFLFVLVLWLIVCRNFVLFFLHLFHIDHIPVCFPSHKNNAFHDSSAWNHKTKQKLKQIKNYCAENEKRRLYKYTYITDRKLQNIKRSSEYTFRKGKKYMIIIIKLLTFTFLMSFALYLSRSLLRLFRIFVFAKLNA